MEKLKICLDAGHSRKYNRSPVLPDYYESDAMWKLHLLQKRYLEETGFQVITTRPTQDTQMEVYNRGAVAKGCVLMLSNHSNACGDPTVDHPTAYRAYDDRNGADGLALALAQRVDEVMGTNQKGRTSYRQNSSGGEYYGVLRGARAAGAQHYIIMEHSFHTNLAATKWLSNEKNLERLAAAECQVIAEFFGVQVPEPAPVDWQVEGLKKLVSAGAVSSPEYWQARWGKSVTVGELMGLLAKLVE